MADGKIIFEKSSYDGGRYLVKGGFYSYGGINWYEDHRYVKKSSAIARAELLLSEEDCDRVIVIDTASEE